MNKYKLVIEYDGTYFIGWQKQSNKRSIQGEIEDAIKIFAQEEVTVYGSSRTDAGVHALAQVAHFSLAKKTTPDTIRKALNSHLGQLSISILDVKSVPENFHSRFDATKRYYKYRVINRKSKLTLEKNRAWHVPKMLDVNKMREAAAMLEGKHDFSSFRTAACQAANPIRTIDRISITKINDLIEVNIEARSFLHSQVRIIVGTLKEIGEGKDLDIAAILAARDRRKAGITAPPHGLYLAKVMVTPTGLEPVLPP